MKNGKGIDSGWLGNNETTNRNFQLCIDSIRIDDTRGKGGVKIYIRVYAVLELMDVLIRPVDAQGFAICDGVAGINKQTGLWEYTCPRVVFASTKAVVATAYDAAGNMASLERVLLDN